MTKEQDTYLFLLLRIRSKDQTKKNEKRSVPMAKKRKDCFPMIREENELLAGFWEALRRDQSAKGETQPAKRKTGSKRQGTGRAEKADPGTGIGKRLRLGCR